MSEPLVRLTSGDGDATVILLHGRGASAEDLFSLAPTLRPGIRGVFPQAPDPFPADFPMGWAWYDMPPDILPGVTRSAKLLEELLDELTDRDPARAARTVLGGFSQGAVMTLDVGLRYRPRLAGLVAMSGYLFDEARAFDYHDAPPPVCLVHGAFDDVVQATRGREARRMLKKHAVEHVYEEFPMGHEISGDSWGFVQEFLGRTLTPTG